VTVIRLSRSMFRRILEEFPDTAIHLHARIAEDLQAMLARINAVVARLAK
jgi:CRP-like cAMP-binding protein